MVTEPVGKATGRGGNERWGHSPGNKGGWHVGRGALFLGYKVVVSVTEVREAEQGPEVVHAHLEHIQVEWPVDFHMGLSTGHRNLGFRPWINMRIAGFSSHGTG